MAKKKWIAGMHLKKGALHQEMGVPEGQKIPEGKLEAAASKPGLLGKRARLAETMKGFKHSPSVEGLREIAKAKKK
jgi:hypothetical protein